MSAAAASQLPAHGGDGGKAATQAARRSYSGIVAWSVLF
jgi:hypothetical protein